jgi:hypothetical protein
MLKRILRKALRSEVVGKVRKRCETVVNFVGIPLPTSHNPYDLRPFVQ